MLESQATIVFSEELKNKSTCMEANLDASGVTILNLISAFIMFGVALPLRVTDFTRIAKNPKAPIVGMIPSFFCYLL